MTHITWWRHQKKHFPRYWAFIGGIHRSPVNSPDKGEWRGALVCSLIRARITGWVNNGEVGDLRRHRAHYDVTVMIIKKWSNCTTKQVGWSRPDPNRGTIPIWWNLRAISFFADSKNPFISGQLLENIASNLMKLSPLDTMHNPSSKAKSRQHVSQHRISRILPI